MIRPNIAAMLVLSLVLSHVLQAQTAYYRHAVFDNNRQPDYYWNSTAQATAPSTLEGKNWRLPVDTSEFLSPPNALRLHWQSNPGGAWASRPIAGDLRRVPQTALASGDAVAGASAR